MATFNFSKPDQGASRSVETKVNTVEFEGYSMDAQDGINSVVETWNLNWTLKTKVEIKAMDDFLKAQAGVLKFAWTTPNGDTNNYKCKSWSTAYNWDGDCSMSASFKQTFEV